MAKATPKGSNINDDTTCDAFLGGRITILQPSAGFRSGLDSVLLAASVNKDTKNILELGSGVGVVACCALADLTSATATLVERQVHLLGLASQNLATNALADRATILELDVTAKGSVRAEAGLASNAFTSVIANPPFFDAASGSHPPDQARAASRHMPDSDLELWVKTAASAAAPKGEAIFIHDAASLPMILLAFTSRFGNIHILPIQPRADQRANRVLVRGIKGSRAPLTLLPAFVLHGEKGGHYLPDADHIFRGKKRLDW